MEMREPRLTSPDDALEQRPDVGHEIESPGPAPEVVSMGQETPVQMERRIVDMFLSSEPQEYEQETYEIKSLSRRFGVPFYVTLRELTEAELQDIFERFDESGAKGARAARKAARQRGLTEMSAHIVAAAWVAPDLTKDVNVPLYQIIRDRIKPLEITALAEKVMDLSGGGDDAVTAVKN